MKSSQAVQTQARDLHFSHTRQSQAGDSWSFALEESRVGPSGAIPACFSFYVRRSRPTYFVDGSTQTVQSCRLSFRKPSLDVYHCVQAARASGRRNRLHAEPALLLKRLPRKRNEVAMASHAKKACCRDSPGKKRNKTFTTARADFRLPKTGKGRRNDVFPRRESGTLPDGI